MSEHQDYIDAHNEWLQTYGPLDFVEYSSEEYERLQSEVDTHYVWTHHGTCENERYSNGLHEFNSACGCWQVFGWYISETPWEGDEDTYLSIDAEWSGPCETCNLDGEDENIDPDCPECDGDGYTQDYFD